MTVAPRLGGRLAQLTVAARDLLVEPPGDPATAEPMLWGSFPTAPWTGRVRRGRFEFEGTTHQLEIPIAPHAIHGTTYRVPWQVEALDRHSVSMSCDLGWEFGGCARQLISIDDDAMHGELSVRAGERAMPAELGWHPWFAKPDSLSFTPEAMYVRDDEGLPTGELITPTEGPWDDCFINTDPVVLRYADVVVTVVSDCDHWVIFDEPLHATCVEPLSGPPDAFTLRPRVLEPGETLQRWWRVSWSW